MKKIIFIISFVLVSYCFTYSQSRWTFVLNGGDAYNMPLPLTIRQQNFPDIKLVARYQTEAFTLPIYWDWRISRWQNDKSWEIEMNHHKLYLDNTTPEVQKFNVSHGFNMIIVNRGFDKKSFQYRAGAGIVFSHPESNIRGQEFGSSVDDLDLGYFISGPVFSFTVSRPFLFGKWFFFNSEVKTTFAYSKIKIAHGDADVFNVAFHLLIGFGVDFLKSNE